MKKKSMNAHLQAGIVGGCPSRLQNDFSSVSEPIALSGQRQLFIDDGIIERMEGLSREMHRLTRHSDRPLYPLPDPPAWERGGIYTRSAPQWIPEEKVYKIWYACYDSLQFWTGNVKTSAGIAVSRDGLRWERPRLGKVRWQGEDTNLIQFGSSVTIYCSGVIYDPHDRDPQRRYKTLVWAPPAFGDYWTAFGWYPVYSTDGIVWSAPVREQRIDNHDDACTIFDSLGNQFLMTGKHWKADGNRMNANNPRDWGIRTSTNFDRWTQDSSVVFAPDRLDQEMGRERLKAIFASPSRLHPAVNRPDEYMTDFYEVAVFVYEGLYFALLTVFDRSGQIREGPFADNQQGILHFQLAASRNLKDWIRLGNRTEFLSAADKTKFDCGGVFPCVPPLVMNNELWFYYCGFSRPHDDGRSIVSKDPDGLGLAKLRRDGFVSLNAAGQTGTLVTRPFLLQGDSLRVNVDASRGELKVALANLDGSLLPGYGFEDAGAVVGDRPAEQVAFRKAALPRSPVRVMFRVTNARLFSFWEGSGADNMHKEAGSP